MDTLIRGRSQPEKQRPTRRRRLFSRRRADRSSRNQREGAAMPRVLDGIRLIEVADWGFVPSAAAVVGDWGGDVIKIEHPVYGDPMRGLITSGLIPGASGINFF